MKKYGRHYLRRCLSVLLAVAMVCAAAQTLVFAVDVTDDPVTPGWYEGTARARYTTSGTLEITFPESTKPGAKYYAEFYDLDAVDEQGNTLRETPVVSAFELTDASTLLAEGEDAKQVSVTLKSDWIKQQKNLDLSHRISIAIIAVKDGWRSEAIEALVGESLDVPESGAAPDYTAQYAPMTRFEVENAGDNDKEPTDYEAGNGYYWIYNKDEDSGSMDINGAYAPYASEPYRHPGFDSSTAFRLYMNGNNLSDGKISAGSDERVDLMYQQDNTNFSGAEELWIWVDTTYVQFDKFALQVRYRDYEGIQTYDRDQKSNKDGDATAKVSADTYSTIGYAKYQTSQGKNVRIPVYRLNDDGLWDTVYTDSDGYLTNFGHYRGFLRVPVEYLYNENYDSTNNPYLTLNEERPYSFKIQIGYYSLGWKKTEWDRISYDGDTIGNDIPASSIWLDPEKLTWYYTTGLGIFEERYDETFSLEKFKNMTGRTLSVVPLNDIATVGITWSGASADSANKSFYIDQIGFSGKSLSGATVSQSTPVDAGLTLTAVDSVNNLITKYLPETVTVADASVIEDLEMICDRLDVDKPDKLNEARKSLDTQLEGTVDIVDYVHRQLNDIGKADIASLYEIYQSFTLGQIHQLGLKDEAKLIDAYNDQQLSEWYPGELGEMYYAPFNDFESNYEVGQTALNEYDDYVVGGPNYYKYAHSMDWFEYGGGLEGHKEALENRENFIAYAWQNYDNDENGLGQRFGYGASTITQNGFDNSKAVNTDIYRDPEGVENYRISVTYQGETAADYTQLEGHSFVGADSFVFYADFTNMSNIRKAWVTIRTADGEVYSHDDGVSGMLTYQFFDLDNPNMGWEDIESNDPDDGCMSGELCGKRGFFKISLGVFGQMGDGSKKLNPSQTIKQVKFFVSGNPNAGKRLNDSFTVDMFGFAADGATSGFEQLKKSSTPVSAPEYTETAVSTVVEQLENLFQPATDLNGKAIYLFNYSPGAYKDILQAYQTLTVTGKQEVNKQISETYGFTIDQLQLFVKNYDEWGGLGEGKLQLNAEEAVTQCDEVKKAFNSSAGTELNTAPVVSILKAYAGYPDYYKYSVQTYWPDRNLNAVFPNYRPDLTVSGLAERDPVKLVLSEDGKKYTGTFTLPYVGAVAEDYGINFTKLPKSVLMQSADDQATITVPIVWVEDQSVQHGENQSLVGTFTISADQIQHAGEYIGSFTFGIDKKADTGSQVENSEQYRKTDITVYVKLVSEASFTVVIPADVQVQWGQVTCGMGNLCMRDCFLPSGAHVDVSVQSPINNYHMRYGEASIQYKLLSGDKVFGGCRFEDKAEVPLSVNVSVDDWDKAPVISDQYQDTLTFTVTYQEAK